MKQVKSIIELRAQRNLLPGIVGLVPTMGYLHEGHMDLVRMAKNLCDHVIVSIYVNPTQFSPDEDLDSYPRNLAQDFSMLRELGVEIVWLPDNTIMYSKGFQTWVEVLEVTQPLEGSMRDGHFKGVTTIVAKLFNCVQPDIAFFGQKDAQQVAVIKQMVADLNFPLKIEVVPISREEDGLARSSRNVYLSKEQREGANVLYRSLNKAKQAYQAGERDGNTIRKIINEELASEKLASPQYVSCANPNTLIETSVIEAEGALISLAVHFGKTRLIDNMLLSD
jgi:pantoate--beta-alanine ligase